MKYREIHMTNVVIASAARTAVGSFGGSFANTPAHDLGAAVLAEVVARAGIDAAEVSETILGQVLTAAQGQNPARQAHINGGLPKESAAWSINQVCGSGLRAVALGAQHIMLGDASVVAAGGQENMTLSPHAAHLRAGHKMGDLKYIDTMIRDGLWDAFNGYHMGQTAENVAEQWQISRDMQDEFAVASQNKAEAAQKAGKFADEIVPFAVKTRKGDIIVDSDEYIRHGANIEAMAKMRPAFAKDGSVTAANASGFERRCGRNTSDVRRRCRKARHPAFGSDRVLCHRRFGPVDHGCRPDLRLSQGTRESWLESRRSGPRRGQRSLCGSGLCGQQRHGLGSGNRERQRRGDCHWTPDRRLWLPRFEHAAV